MYHSHSSLREGFTRNNRLIGRIHRREIGFLDRSALRSWVSSVVEHVDNDDGTLPLPQQMENDEEMSFSNSEEREDSSSWMYTRVLDTSWDESDSEDDNIIFSDIETRNEVGSYPLQMEGLSDDEHSPERMQEDGEDIGEERDSDEDMEERQVSQDELSILEASPPLKTEQGNKRKAIDDDSDEYDADLEETHIERRPRKVHRRRENFSNAG